MACARQLEKGLSNNEDPAQPVNNSNTTFKIEQNFQKAVFKRDPACCCLELPASVRFAHHRPPIPAHLEGGKCPAPVRVLLRSAAGGAAPPTSRGLTPPRALGKPPEETGVEAGVGTARGQAPSCTRAVSSKTCLQGNVCAQCGLP